MENYLQRRQRKGLLSSVPDARLVTRLMANVAYRREAWKGTVIVGKLLAEKAA